MRVLKVSLWLKRSWFTLRGFTLVVSQITFKFFLFDDQSSCSLLHFQLHSQHFPFPGPLRILLQPFFFDLQFFPPKFGFFSFPKAFEVLFLL